MPSRKNAVLQLRKSATRATRNSIVKSQLKTARKNFESVCAGGEQEKTEEALKTLVSVIDKSTKKGVIPKGRGSRLKSKYALKTGKIGKETASGRA